jgi:hypothetical protein
MHFADVPPIGVPFRFYLTAPAFGVLAGVLLLVEGPGAWSSRWTDATLAATHLLSLGFIAMVMLGSLFQVVPVLGGRPLPGTRGVAWLVHAALTVGAAILSLSLLRPDLGLWLPAIVSLCAAFGVFLVALACRLARRAAGGDSMFVLRLAALSLAATVGLGLYQAIRRGWPQRASLSREWTDVHAGWGFAGWIALLVMAVSFQVLPMFQVAPAFHSGLARGTALALFAGLVAISHAREPWLVVTLTTVIAGALVVWAVHALRTLARRRRRRRDALNAFWHLSLASLIAVAVLTWLRACLPVAGWLARGELLIGALAIFGFTLSVMLGMLLKIAAFLAFLHLQRRCLSNLEASRHLPTMTDLVSEAAAMSQLWLHCATVAAVVAAVLWPAAGALAALLIIADFALLAGWLIAALVRYRRADAAIHHRSQPARAPQ